MTKKIFLIIACILIPLIAEGADWVRVIETDKSIFYVDASSVNQIAFNNYQAWFKTEFIKDNLLKKTMVFASFDCGEKKRKKHQITYYKYDGSSKKGGEQEWEYVMPESNMETVLDFVCRAF